MAQAPAKHHDPDRRDDRHDDRRDDRSDARREPDPLVMPLAEPALGAPIPTVGVTGELLEDGERDPHTIAEEQRIRSAAYEAGLDPEAELEAARSGGDAAPPRRVAPPVQHQAPKPEPHAQQAHHGETHHSPKK